MSLEEDCFEEQVDQVSEGDDASPTKKDHHLSSSHPIYAQSLSPLLADHQLLKLLPNQLGREQSSGVFLNEEWQVVLLFLPQGAFGGREEILGRGVVEWEHGDGVDSGLVRPEVNLLE